MCSELKPMAEIRFKAEDLTTLTEKEKHTVRKCILRYSTPTNWSEMIFWLSYRIQNAIKHLWGASDWQISEKIFDRRIMEHFDRQITDFLNKANAVPPNSSDKHEKSKRNGLLEIVQVISSTKLIRMLIAQNAKIDCTIEQLNKILEQNL